MNAKNTNTFSAESAAVVLQTNEDLKNSILIVSLIANLFVLTAWLVVQADPSITLALLETR